MPSAHPGELVDYKLCAARAAAHTSAPLVLTSRAWLRLLDVAIICPVLSVRPHRFAKTMPAPCSLTPILGRRAGCAHAKARATRPTQALLACRYLIQEFCVAGSLAKLLAGRALQTACSGVHITRVMTCLRHIAAGMAHMHRLRMVHGDLNPCNVLLQVRAAVDAPPTIVPAGFAATSAAHNPSASVFAVSGHARAAALVAAGCHTSASCPQLCVPAGSSGIRLSQPLLPLLVPQRFPTSGATLASHACEAWAWSPPSLLPSQTAISGLRANVRCTQSRQDAESARPCADRRVAAAAAAARAARILEAAHRGLGGRARLGRVPAQARGLWPVEPLAGGPRPRQQC